MRRIISAIVCLVCVCMLLAMPVAAAPTDPLALDFQAFIDECDSLYAGDVMEYALWQVKAAYVSGEKENISADAFEVELSKYMVLDETLKVVLRSPENGYNQETDTYSIQHSAEKPEPDFTRQYKGYVKTGENTYEVYYQAFVRGYLKDSVLETEKSEIIRKYKNPITGNVEYNGKTYVRDAEGYYCVKSWKESGIKYSIEVNGDQMRFIRADRYDAGAQPDTFDDVVVNYDLPKDNTVYLSDVACFPDDTTVKVEKITEAAAVRQVAQAMAKVSTQYVPYEFTAGVQPTGRLKVCFAIPEGFGMNVAVMYLAPDGTLTELSSELKNIEGTSFLYADLEHFSTYILVDMDAKPVDSATEPTPAPTAEPATVPTTAVTSATGDTKATVTATKATDAATKVTLAPATKPTGVPVVKPTVKPAGDAAEPTAETVADPTAENTVDPTNAVSAPTDETVADSIGEDPAPKKSNKTGIIVAAVILVLAGGGTAAWWFFFKKKNA